MSGFNECRGIDAGEVSDHEFRREDLIAGGPLQRVDLQQVSDHFGQLVRKVFGNFGVRTRKHCAVKPVHVDRFEGRVQRSHFVDYAPQRPDIAFVVVRLVSPHLRACVVRRARLSVKQTILLGYLRYIQIAQYEGTVGLKKNVRRLQISVQN
jgi:hypothetical protein